MRLRVDIKAFDKLLYDLEELDYMIITHQGKSPMIDSTAYIAPNAVICGDVIIGKNCKVMFGAQVIAEAGAIVLGENTVVLENAVLRSTQNYPLSIGKNCLIGPHTHIVGCLIEENVFIATGASIFHGAILESGSEVRINGVVHIKTHLAKNSTVPIGWVAVGNPAQIFSPDKHEQIWELQAPLNFPLTVYGIDRNEVTMEKIVKQIGARLQTHADDQLKE